MSQMSISHPGLLASEARTNERLAFIRKTYLHLFGAIFVFTALETLLFSSGVAAPIAQSLSGSWIIVLLVFLGVSWLANWWASSDTSPALQYAGLGLFIVAEAIIFEAGHPADHGRRDVVGKCAVLQFRSSSRVEGRSDGSLQRDVFIDGMSSLGESLNRHACHRSGDRGDLVGLVGRADGRPTHPVAIRGLACPQKVESAVDGGGGLDPGRFIHGRILSIHRDAERWRWWCFDDNRNGWRIGLRHLRWIDSLINGDHRRLLPRRGLRSGGGVGPCSGRCTDKWCSQKDRC